MVINRLLNGMILQVGHVFFAKPLSEGFPT